MNSVYISDFESESGSELIERRPADLKVLEAKPNVRKGYFPVAEVEEECEVSWKKSVKEPEIESLETDVHDKQAEENFTKHENSSSLMKNSKNSDFFDKEKKTSNFTKGLVKDSNSVKIEKIEQKIELRQESKQKNVVKNEFKNSEKGKVHDKKGSLISMLKLAVEKDKAGEGDRLDAEYNRKSDFYYQVHLLMENEGFTPSVRLKKPPANSSNFPSITVHAPNNPKPSEKIQDEFSTPSFSEQEPYGKFETFGKVKEAFAPTYTEEDGQYEMIYIENDNEQEKNIKLKKLEDRRVKRIEELEKRIVKKTLTPEKAVKLGLKISNSPVPSPKPSPRPSLKVEMRNSPKPTHKTREEVKSVGEKYKRHKNLPNLVYNKPSNRKIIKNAISQLCLAGEPNKGHREEVLGIIERLVEVNYFIIVFSDSVRRDVRGLYSHDPNTSEVAKVFGPGYLPDLLDSNVVAQFFRYDSGAKEFKILQCKDFIAATDAICLKKIHKVYENN